MSIRPIDLQSSYYTAAQNAGNQARAEAAPAAAQAAAQAAFAAKAEERAESVAALEEAQGSKVEVTPDGGGNAGGGREYHERKHPATPFEEVVEDAAGYGEQEHFIDFTA
jgi:hypothetical protein